MSNPPALIFDADMVLLDWACGFVRYMEGRHGIKTNDPLHRIVNYSLTSHYPSLTKANIKDFIAQFAEDGDYFRNIPIYPHVEDVIGKFRNHFPGIPFVCVTACGSHPKTREYRLENLEPLALDVIHTIDMGASKAEILNSFAPGCWFVDDHVGHIADGEAAGHHCVLMDQLFNAEADVTHRAMDWPHLFDILTQAPSPSLAA